MAKRSDSVVDKRRKNDGGSMRETKSSGSHVHRGERSGAGEREGSDELPARGPGAAAETRHGLVSTAYPSRTTPGAQKNVAVQNPRDEE